MKQRTESFTLRPYRGDPDKLRELQQALQERLPDRIVTQADVFRLCVGSASVALAAGQLHGLPEPKPLRDG